MLHEFFVTGQRISRKVYMIYLMFASVVLLGVGWQGWSFSLKYLLWPVRLSSRPEFYNFLRCVVQHLRYLIFLDYQTLHSGKIEGQCEICAHYVLVVLLVHPLIIQLHRFGALPCWAYLLLSVCLNFVEISGDYFCLSYPQVPQGPPKLPQDVLFLF